MIEIMYPEICNLYADSANTRLLKTIFKDKVFETSLNEEPKFIKDKNIKLIYFGWTNESHQLLMIKKLKQYEKQIKNAIENNIIFLCTGNSLEIFGKYIKENNKKIQALNIFDYYTKLDLNHRMTSLYLGKYNDIDILGFRAQFSKTYNIKNNVLFKTIRGEGINEKEQDEGFRYKNFIATYLTGPLLIINPYFTKEILKLLDYNKPLPNEDALIDAYNKRLKEFNDPKTNIIPKH